jgi:trk system potassium uptake protein TrkA
LRAVIVGAGEIGFHFAEWFVVEKKEVVVVDVDSDRLRWVSDHLDVQILHGSGSNPKVLREAGVETADIILAVTHSDEVNLIACFFANIISPQVRKVALVRNPDYSEYQDEMAKHTMNLSTVINPEMEVVKSILRIVSAPDVEEVSDFVGGSVKMFGKHLSPDSSLTGLKLLQLPEKIAKNRMVVAAMIRDERLIIPRGKDVLRAGDLVYFVCAERDSDYIAKLFGRQTPHGIKNVLIVGGGNIGFPLAQELERKRYNVKLIEKEADRCQMLSARLHRTIVLQGYATDQKFLEQENIGSMDMVVSVTWDEEMNILSSLLAKRLGATRTIARINKFPYIPLVQAIGIDHIVSPRLSAINSLFPYVHRGNVISTVTIRGNQAEILEAVALPSSEIVGKSLKHLKFPKDTLVLCIMRGHEMIIPSGDSTVEAEDRVLILSTIENIPRVEQALEAR